MICLFCCWNISILSRRRMFTGPCVNPHYIRQRSFKKRNWKDSRLFLSMNRAPNICSTCFFFVFFLVLLLLLLCGTCRSDLGWLNCHQRRSERLYVSSLWCRTAQTDDEAVWVDMRPIEFLGFSAQPQLGTHIRRNPEQQWRARFFFFFLPPLSLSLLLFLLSPWFRGGVKKKVKRWVLIKRQQQPNTNTRGRMRRRCRFTTHSLLHIYCSIGLCVQHLHLSFEYIKGEPPTLE